MIFTRRVVVTGMGAVTPIGIGVQNFRISLREGACGVGPLTRFESNGLGSRNVFEVKNFIPPKGAKQLDPFIQYALAATAEAIENAGFKPETEDPFRIGVCVGSSKGGLHSFYRLHEKFLKQPNFALATRGFSNLIPHFASQWISKNGNSGARPNVMSPHALREQLLSLKGPEWFRTGHWIMQWPGQATLRLCRF